MTTRRYIAEMEPSQRVEGVFAIANAQMGRTRQDKPYLRCLLSDKSGEAPARMWSIDEATFKGLPVDGFVWIEGEAQAYQGQLQIIIHQVQSHEPTVEQMKELLPVTSRDIGEMWDELVRLMGSLSHPGMKALGELFLEDEYFVEAFKRAPAAKALHHSHLGGLLEHTVTLMQIADRICPLYPRISRDLVVMGCFLQDIGKTRELRYDRAFAYTDMGELIGHIVEGTHMLRDKCELLMREKGVRLPAGAAMVLEHIILSHHNLPEHGAAKPPMTPEAVLVAHIDALDAKTVIALDAARPEQAAAADLGGNFTDRSWALGVKLYRPDPLGA
ncbi:MAG: HD domain-containing protein [Phycisphaeraceae bacterium]|nr:MAG: HD domain-containing protein [Phycisphaeraceae bacterium]